MFSSKFKVDDDDFYKVLFDGGEDDGDTDQKPKKGRSHAEKYSDDLDQFKAKDFNRDRGCTDKIFLFIFVSFLGSMIYLTTFGLQNGDIKRLLAPIDGDGKFCGVNHVDEENPDLSYDYTDYEYLMITEYSSNVMSIFNSAICVDKCPQAEEAPDCKTTEAVASCPESGEFLIETRSIMGICIPSIDDIPGGTETLESLLSVFEQSSAGTAVNDVVKASKAVNISLGLSVVWCIVFIYLMSLFAEQLIWICIVLVKLTLLFVTGGFGYMLKVDIDIRSELTGGEELPEGEEPSAELQELNDKIFYLSLATGVAGTLTLIYMCCIFCNCDSLKKAIDVIDAASDYLRKTKRVVLVPCLFFILQLVAVKIWLFCYFCVISMNKIEAGSLQMKTMEWEPQVKWMAGYMIFGIFWVTAWLDYMSRFIIMVSTSTYYFNSNGR